MHKESDFRNYTSAKPGPPTRTKTKTIIIKFHGPQYDRQGAGDPTVGNHCTKNSHVESNRKPTADPRPQQNAERE